MENQHRRLNATEGGRAFGGWDGPKSASWDDGCGEHRRTARVRGGVVWINSGYQTLGQGRRAESVPSPDVGDLFRPLAGECRAFLALPDTFTFYAPTVAETTIESLNRPSARVSTSRAKIFWPAVAAYWLETVCGKVMGVPLSPGKVAANRNGPL